MRTPPRKMPATQSQFAKAVALKIECLESQSFEDWTEDCKILPGQNDEVLTHRQQRSRLPKYIQHVAKGQMAQHALQVPGPSSHQAL
jgi:hypothetical protein